MWCGCSDAGICGWVCTRVCVWRVCTCVHSYTLDPACVSADVRMRRDLPFLVLCFSWTTFWESQPAEGRGLLFFPVRFYFGSGRARAGASLGSRVRDTDSSVPPTAGPARGRCPPARGTGSPAPRRLPSGPVRLFSGVNGFSVCLSLLSSLPVLACFASGSSLLRDFIRGIWWLT